MKSKTLQIPNLILALFLLFLSCEKEESINLNSNEPSASEMNALITLLYDSNSIFYTEQSGNDISPNEGQKPTKRIINSVEWKLKGNYFVATANSYAFTKDDYVCHDNCDAFAQVMLVKNNAIFDLKNKEVIVQNSVIPACSAEAKTNIVEWKYEVNSVNYENLRNVYLVAQGKVRACYGGYEGNYHSIRWADDRRVLFALPMPEMSIPILQLISQSNNSATLNWTASTGNLVLKRYDIYKNGSFLASTTANSYTAAGLISGNTYSFFVKAVSVEDFETTASTAITLKIAGEMQSPTAPGNLSATDINSSGAKLIWNPSTDNVGVACYVIYKNNIQLATSTTPNYQVSGLISDKIYNFYVIAKDQEGNTSEPSNTISVKTLPLPMLPPSTPANLTINSNVTLSWNTSLRANNYKIYRKQDSGDFVFLSNTTNNTFTDNSVLPRLTTSWFYYKVQAENNSGVSDFSNIVSIQGETYE